MADNGRNIQLNESVAPSASPFLCPGDGNDGPVGSGGEEKKKRAAQRNDNLINRGKDVNEPVSP